MQATPSSRAPAAVRAAVAVLAALLVGLFGAALAQEQPADLFGSLPEPPTEAKPAAPAIDPASPAYGVLQQPAEAFSSLPADARGKPDLVRLALTALRESGAEAVICIANQKLTKDVIQQMERRGIPAYGAIWDS